MEDAQETSLGPSEPLGAGVREEVKALPAVQGPPAGWGGGSLFGLVCVYVCVYACVCVYYRAYASNF